MFLARRSTTTAQRTLACFNPLGNEEMFLADLCLTQSILVRACFNPLGNEEMFLAFFFLSIHQKLL